MKLAKTWAYIKHYFDEEIHSLLTDCCMFQLGKERIEFHMSHCSSYQQGIVYGPSFVHQGSKNPSRMAHTHSYHSWVRTCLVDTQSVPRSHCQQSNLGRYRTVYNRSPTTTHRLETDLLTNRKSIFRTYYPMKLSKIKKKPITKAIVASFRTQK